MNYLRTFNSSISNNCSSFATGCSSFAKDSFQVLRSKAATLPTTLSDYDTLEKRARVASFAFKFFAVIAGVCIVGTFVAANYVPPHIGFPTAAILALIALVTTAVALKFGFDLRNSNNLLYQAKSDFIAKGLTKVFENARLGVDWKIELDALKKKWNLNILFTAAPDANSWNRCDIQCNPNMISPLAMNELLYQASLAATFVRCIDPKIKDTQVEEQNRKFAFEFLKYALAKAKKESLTAINDLRTFINQANALSFAPNFRLHDDNSLHITVDQYSSSQIQSLMKVDMTPSSYTLWFLNKAKMWSERVKKQFDATKVAIKDIPQPLPVEKDNKRFNEGEWRLYKDVKNALSKPV